MEIREKANNYAEKKTNEVLIQAIAQAYIDGYQDGYQACKEEIPLDVQKDQTVYVDLGLPSGTLWAAEDECKDGKRMYLPYVKASAFNLPTEEQWRELLQKCEWDYKYFNGHDKRFVCIGPNGNVIHFGNTGFKKEEKSDMFSAGRVFMWIKDDSIELQKNAVTMYIMNTNTYYKKWKKCLVGINFL